MLDAQLIAAAIQDRASYDKFREHFKAKDFSPQGDFWLTHVKAWYKRDRLAKSIDKSLLAQQGEKHITNPDHREALMGFLNDMPEAPSPDNVVQVALELKRYTVGMELASAIGAHNSKKIAELTPEFVSLQQATTLVAKRTEWEDAAAVEQLFEKVGQENRKALSPKLLNDRTNGGALPGHHILIFGRPEAGKSSFAINMAAGFLRRGERVLYIGNEDQINILKGRMLSRITQMTFEQCEKNKESAIAKFRKAGGEDRLLMTQMKHGTMDAVRAKCDEFLPTVVVLDQIRGLQSTEDGLTRALEANATAMRSLVLDYGMIGVSVTQANDRTEKHGQEPPMFLSMGDVDSSRTGLPGQIDLMLGIGKTQDLENRGQRAISLPKNKLSSADNAHEGFLVTFDKHRSTFK